MSLKTIKTKIRSVEKTHQVTKAMEAVSAVKMRKSQARALLGRPYAVHALSILKRVTASSAGAMHPILRGRKDTSISKMRTLFVVITSDKGLAGSLNSALLKEVARTMREQGLSREDVGFVTIGKKAFEYFSKRGFTIEHNILLREEAISIDALRELADRIAQFYASGTYDRALVAYTQFRSTMSQSPALRQIVPVSTEEIEAIVRDIIPERGRYAELEANGGATQNVEYLFEPSAQTILDELVPFLLTVELYHAALEAEASEHSARMVAMKNASDKAEEVAEMLTIDFNKARQTAITREVSEIVGGVEAMR